MFKKKKTDTEGLVDALVKAIASLCRVTVTELPEYRPCWVNGRRAIFHRWVNSARPQLPRGQEPNENSRYYQYRATHAIVEYEDGTIATIWPTELIFADGGTFRECWRQVESEVENG